MIPAGPHVEPYVLGFRRHLGGGACRPPVDGVVPPGWPWPAPSSCATRCRSRPLAIVVFYWHRLAHRVAHVHRYRLAMRELTVRLRLEEEQRARRPSWPSSAARQEDPLTGLANRRRWDAELEAACAEARRAAGRRGRAARPRPLQEVNDRHGHAGGTGRSARWPAARRAGAGGRRRRAVGRRRARRLLPAPTSSARWSSPSGCGARRPLCSRPASRRAS